MTIGSPSCLQTWQIALRDAIATPEALWQTLQLPAHLLADAKRASELFPLRVPLGFIERMQKGNIHDPLLRQVLPLDAETKSAPGFVSDPLEEKAANPVSGLLHKYHGRVLLTLTGSCAVHCRYCFRRHFPYQDNNPGRDGWQRVWSYIREHGEVSEVILSGGDPLMATDRVLYDVMQQLDAIAHVKTVRIHTRLPIVLPERITSTLLDCFRHTRLRCVCVIHCNHAQEIDQSVATALAKLANTGFMLLNQAVLLNGVNDSAKCIIDLSQQLFAHSVLPYYLHRLDKVSGTHHFFVSDKKANSIMQNCRTHLPGYLVPRYVTEQPGEKSKLAVL